MGPAVKTLDAFELMRLFVRIAETGSLTTAAQSLAISQPTASRQLKQLEQLLGAQLMRRSTHELTLTDSGNHFLEDARAMLAQWETSLDTLRNERRLAYQTGFNGKGFVREVPVEELPPPAPVVPAPTRIEPDTEPQIESKAVVQGSLFD